MKAFLTGYRCNCTAVELAKESIPTHCPTHGAEIIYGLSGPHEQVEIDESIELGVKA